MWNFDARYKLHAIPRFLAGSFAVQFKDHFRSGDICGRGSFAALYNTTKEISLKQSSILDSEISVLFSLNEHGDLYILLQ